jgi:hypothetical protein
MRKSILRTAVMSVGLAMLSGCTSYYKVTDPSTNRVYYTEHMKEAEGGAVKFKDGGSGEEVTIQNSQTQKIDEQQYQEGLRMEAAKAVQRTDASVPPKAPPAQ